jgi:M6 family metalloprotease-like protein
MIDLIFRKKSLWFCISIALLTIIPTCWAAPPHPRLLLQQLDRAFKPMLNVMGSSTLQTADPDIPREGYIPQPDGIEYLLAILVDFPDQPGQKAPADFNDALFGISGSSMKLYFEEVSYGQMTVRPGYLNGVAPGGGRWQRARKPMTYYGHGTGVAITEIYRYEELIQEACESIDPDIDFSRYDRDGDGYVDHLMIIHAGDDEASSGISTDIWSAVIDDIPGVYDGVRMSSAMVVAEDPSSDLINIGIYCHEFFHEFGAPDLYSWERPVGHWCLMAYEGPYQDDGQHPSHISGYLKWDFDANPFNGIDGWLEPTNLTSHGTYSVDSLELPEGNRLYKVDIPSKQGREYFLIENRNKLSGAIYDTHLPESGIVIWHIDETRSVSYPQRRRAWVEDPTDPDHSGFGKATKGAAYSADDGQTSFTPATQPNSSTNDDEYSGIIITDIGWEGMTMSFTYFSGDTYEPNNSIANAYGLLEYGREYSSYIRDDEDKDFFKFHADADSNVLVYLANIPEDLNYDLYIFDSRGELIDDSTGQQQTEETLDFKAHTAGVYYAMVSSRDGYSSTRPYSLTIDSIPLAPGTIAISRVYPNPGPGEKDTIWFDYKLLDPVERITLDIYTPTGTLVYTHSESTVSRTGRFSWDARTNSGRRVASGIYVYVLKADLNGETNAKTGKIAVIY